jgi:RHS repeat-associated protein
VDSRPFVRAGVGLSLVAGLLATLGSPALAAQQPTTAQLPSVASVPVSPVLAQASAGYVGGTADPTGLTHLGAREYDPTIGRFISVDPVQAVNDPQQWQGYAYATNNPTTLSDAGGLEPGSWCNDSTCGSSNAKEQTGHPMQRTSSSWGSCGAGGAYAAAYSGGQAGSCQGWKPLIGTCGIAGAYASAYSSGRSSSCGGWNPVGENQSGRYVGGVWVDGNNDPDTVESALDATLGGSNLANGYLIGPGNAGSYQIRCGNGASVQDCQAKAELIIACDSVPGACSEAFVQSLSASCGCVIMKLPPVTSWVIPVGPDPIPEAPGSAEVNEYRDLTRPGSRFPNRGVDLTRSEFEQNLGAAGWSSRTSADGKVTIFEKNGARYVVRDNATSTGGPTADYYRPGSSDISLKIRLDS